MKYVVQGTVIPPRVDAPPPVLFMDWDGASGRPIPAPRRPVLNPSRSIMFGTQAPPSTDVYWPQSHPVIRREGPKRPQTNLARTITFTEMAPLEWIHDYSHEFKFSIPARSKTFFSQARTISFSELQPMDWFAPVPRSRPAARTHRPLPLALIPFFAAPAETVTMDKWSGSGEWRVRRIRPFVSRYRAIQYAVEEPIVPETITMDKWTRPPAEVRRPKPRPFFSSARTLTFSELRPLDWPLLLQRQHPRKRPYQPAPFALIPVFAAAEDITLDKWSGPSAEVRREKPRPFFSQARTIIHGTIPVVENIFWVQPQTLLKHFRAVYPTRPIADLIQVLAAPGETVTVDKWLRLDAQIRRERPRPLFHRETRATPAAPNIIWVQPQIRLRQPLARAQRPAFIDVLTTVFSETITSDKWTPQLGQVLRPRFFQRKQPFALIPFFGQSQETVTMDKWGEITRFLHDRARHPIHFSVDTLTTQFTETVSLDRWIGSSNRTYAPRDPLIDQNVIIPFFGTGEALTLDKWLGSQGNVIRALLRSASRDLIHLPQLISFVETITPDKWAGSTGRIIRPPIGPREPFNLVQLVAEPLTLDKWHSPAGRILMPADMTYRDVAGLIHAPADFITLDKWTGSANRRAESRRQATMDVAHLVIAPAEQITLDKWIGPSVRRLTLPQMSYRDLAQFLRVTPEVLTSDKWTGTSSYVLRVPARIIPDLRHFFSSDQEMVTIDRWDFWKHQPMRPARPPIIVNLIALQLLDVVPATGRLEIYRVAGQDRTYVVAPEWSQGGRIYIVPPPEDY